jgi:hypothetical protein
MNAPPAQPYKTVRKRLSSIKPSPENERLYRPIDPEDADIITLAESIAERGLREPIVVTADGYIVSGHRRYAACLINEQVVVPCIVLSSRRDEYADDEYLALLRDYNRQRHKNIAEQVRETLVDHADGGDAYAVLKDYRQKTVFAAQHNGIETLDIKGSKVRRPISPSSAEHVRLIKKMIFEDRRDYWPMSCRAVHYPLLNYDFFRSIYKKIKYANDRQSSKATADLITRLRLIGVIPWEAIEDETRPVAKKSGFSDVREFIKREIDAFCTGYWRDLQQSQPNHIEVLCEKNTIFNMVLRITQPYQIVTGSGRGFSSIDYLRDIYVRYRQSRRERLILVVLSDYDPSGEEIPQVVGRTMRDDFGLASDEFDIIKAGVTREQITKYKLPSGGEAKAADDKRAPAFIKANDGDGRIYELEALEPQVMLNDLDAVLRGVMDLDAYNHEVEEEESEAYFLQTRQKAAGEALKGLLL